MTWPLTLGIRLGPIGNKKTGDIVVELGPEHVAAGARIVLEAKDNASYTMDKARVELDEARKNRQAGVGVFVWSRQAAPAGTNRFIRHDDDIFVIWDSEDPQHRHSSRGGSECGEGDIHTDARD